MAEGEGVEGGTHRWGSTYPPGAGQCQGGQGLLSGKTCLCLGAQLCPVTRASLATPPRVTAQPRLGSAQVRSCLGHAHVSERTTEAWDEGGAWLVTQAQLGTDTPRLQVQRWESRLGCGWKGV